MDILTDFIFEYDRWIRFFHVAGAIVAVGAVVATDLFLLWLKFKPSAAVIVARTAPLLSLQVWIGLMIIAVTGLLMFLARPGLEAYSPFQWKMLLVLLVFLNGVFLNVWVTPRFKELAPEWTQQTDRVKTFTKIAGIATAVSFAGWWAIVLLMLVFY